MAWTQTDIDALKAAIASGAMSVSYSGPPARTITYRSLDEMRGILVQLEREVLGASAVTSRRVAWSKGFRDA